MSNRESIYVMREIEGEECLEATPDSFAAAMALARQDSEPATLSIWSSTRGILVLWNPEAGDWIATKRATAEEAREVES